MTMRTLTSALAISAVCLVPLTAESVKVQSPETVRQLVASMKQAGLSAIATRDPGRPGNYVAAMLFPGVQLLVIRAQTTAPEYVEAELAAGRYEAVYNALHQGVPASKLFVQDMGSDGLGGADGGLADIIYRHGVDQHVLNGDHKAAKLSAPKYAALVGELDRQYTQVLGLLLESANHRASSRKEARR